MISPTSEQTWASLRAPLWDELAVLVQRARRDRRLTSAEVEVLGLRSQQVAADLSYLRTHHPSSPLLPRLNDLVARSQAIVYRRRRGSLREVLQFLSTGYPRLVWSLRRPIGLCAGLGLTITVIAFAWALSDPVTAASYLPSGVRDAAYFHHEPIPTGVMAPVAAGIFMNNIVVSFYAFGGGLTLGLLTLHVLYTNSMLLGVLSGVTNKDGVNTEYWSLILPHGVLELSAFAIAGGAGLALADAVIRARPEPRSVVVRRTAARAGLVAAGTMPLLVVAGLIEGFVTPSGLPIAAKLAVAPLTGVLLALYLLRGRDPRSVEVESPT
jgi:uncharacterized membrane protein SpoIIM required for sporulation